MKIKYIPEIINGEQAQGDSIIKYNFAFDKGEVREIENKVLAEKLLTAPYFVESNEEEKPQLVKEAPKKKRGRPARVIDVEADEQD